MMKNSMLLKNVLNKNDDNNVNNEYKRSVVNDVNSSVKNIYKTIWKLK